MLGKVMVRPGIPWQAIHRSLGEGGTVAVGDGSSGSVGVGVGVRIGSGVAPGGIGVSVAPAVGDGPGEGDGVGVTVGVGVGEGTAAAWHIRQVWSVRPAWLGGRARGPVEPWHWVHVSCPAMGWGTGGAGAWPPATSVMSRTPATSPASSTLPRIFLAGLLCEVFPGCTYNGRVIIPPHIV